MSIRLKKAKLSANDNGELKDIDLVYGNTSENINALEEKANEVLSSIPSDYTTLVNQVGSLNDNLGTKLGKVASTVTDVNNAIVTGNDKEVGLFFADTSATNLPVASQRTLIVSMPFYSHGIQIAETIGNNKLFIRQKISDTWQNWQELVLKSDIAYNAGDSYTNQWTMYYGMIGSNAKISMYIVVPKQILASRVSSYSCEKLVIDNGVNSVNGTITNALLDNATGRNRVYIEITPASSTFNKGTAVNITFTNLNLNFG